MLIRSLWIKHPIHQGRIWTVYQCISSAVSFYVLWLHLIRHSPPVVDAELPVWYACVAVISVAFVPVLPKDATKTVISTWLTVSAGYSTNIYKSKANNMNFVYNSSVIHAVKYKLSVIVFCNFSHLFDSLQSLGKLVLRLHIAISGVLC